MKIPVVIDAYFAAEQLDSPDALKALFTSDAVVIDEQTKREGVDAIAAWWLAAKKEYGHTTEPLEAQELDGMFIVHGRVTGKFPGSPLVLTYRFLLDAQKIARLEIG